MQDKVVPHNLESKFPSWLSRPFYWRFQFVNHLYMMSLKYKFILTGEFGLVTTVYDTVVCTWEPPVGVSLLFCTPRLVQAKALRRTVSKCAFLSAWFKREVSSFFYALSCSDMSRGRFMTKIMTIIKAEVMGLFCKVTFNADFLKF